MVLGRVGQRAKIDVVMVPTSFSSFFLHSYSADIVLLRRPSSHGGTDLSRLNPALVDHFHHPASISMQNPLLWLLGSSKQRFLSASITSMNQLACGNILTWRVLDRKRRRKGHADGKPSPSKPLPTQPVCTMAP